MLSRVKYGGVVVLGEGRGGEGGGMHCALDLKWGGAETMAMKKTWQEAAHFHYSGRHGAQNGA